MTKLERLIFGCPEFRALGMGATKEEKQRVLDQIADKIVTGNEELIASHVREVYDDTADEYVANPHNQGIIPELITFMDMLPDGASVLDIGCGPGRDALFMSIGNDDFRATQMGRVSGGKTVLQKFGVPKKVFSVIGIDTSGGMLKYALRTTYELMGIGLIPMGEIFPMFICGDMRLFSPGEFDGIWSCAALLTHTPSTQVQRTIEKVSGLLNKGGILFLSYTNGREDGHYDKLLLSSTGRIKYFSQPDPDFVSQTAIGCSLKLLSESFGDFEVGGKILKKNLFASQFFKKI